MGQVRHGSATTTHAVRSAIQRSQASLAQLSRELGINPKTVAKWRKRGTVEDLKTGPKEPRSTVLTEAEEAMVVAFRRHTLLPLDDCLYALQPSLPHLTRSALHRCLQRHGISRLPDIEGDKPKRQRFKPYPIGFFHIDIADVQTAEGKLYLFGDKGRDDRLFLEAMHYFSVHNISWRALPERCGKWNSVWKRFDQLSKAGVFEAFFDHLAALLSSAHLVQMFDSTIVRAHVSAAGAKGGRRVRRSAARVVVSQPKST